jgi:hypothetical protein
LGGRGNRAVGSGCGRRGDGVIGFGGTWMAAWLLVFVAVAVAACAASGLQEGSAAARDPNVKGATGQAVVIGSGSSMAGSQRVHPDWSQAGVGAQRGD